MTTKTNANGQERKTLASQLDRLDAILDALGVGLNEAVASAVQDVVGTAVTAAVQAAVVEVLTNPELLERLRPAPAPQPPAPSFFSRLTAKARGWWARLGSIGPLRGELLVEMDMVVTPWSGPMSSRRGTPRGHHFRWDKDSFWRLLEQPTSEGARGIVSGRARLPKGRNRLCLRGHVVRHEFCRVN